MVDIEWTGGALKDLRSLDHLITKRILKKITYLFKHFDSITPEDLSGDFAGAFKLRVSDWRVA